MVGTPPTISTNNTSFNVGDTLYVTITFNGSYGGYLYVGDTEISIVAPRGVSSYIYSYDLTTSGVYNVHFYDYMNLLDSNIIAITVTGSSSSSSVFLTTITKVKTALENVFVKKSDVKDNLTSTDTDKPLSANQGKELKTLIDGKANSNHNHGYITNNGYLDGRFETTNELSIIEPHISNYSGNECLYTLNGKLVYDGNDEILVYDKEGFTEIEELDESSEIATIGDIPNVTGKEDESNKSSSITTDTGSTTKYPTVKAVEDYAQPKGNYLTSHQDLTNYIQKSNTNGLIKNDGTIDTSTYLDIEKDINIVSAVVTYTDDSTETLSMLTCKPKPPLLIIIDPNDSYFSGVQLLTGRLYKNFKIIEEVNYDSVNNQFKFENAPYGEYHLQITLSTPIGSSVSDSQNFIYDINNFEYNREDIFY